MTQNPGDQGGEPGPAYSGPQQEPNQPEYPEQPPALAYPEYPGYGPPPGYQGYQGFPGYQPHPVAPGYAAYPPYPPYPPPRDTNVWAILALISALTIPPLAIIAGHVALFQIKRKGDQGRGLAIAGLVIGYLLTFLFLAAIGFIVWIESYYENELYDYNRDYGVYSMPVTSGLAETDGAVRLPLTRV